MPTTQSSTPPVCAECGYSGTNHAGYCRHGGPVTQAHAAQAGTEWCRVGEGASGAGLAVAIQAAHPNPFPWTALCSAAWLHAVEHAKTGGYTNLRLTGHPLQPEDLERISRCEVAR